MGYNNSMYRFYQEMLNGYNSKNDAVFEHGARSMMALNPESPFKEDTPENELFCRMRLCYIKWHDNGVDHRVNYRRLVAAGKELCEIVKYNPYTFDKKEDDLDKAEQKRQEELRKLEEERKKEEQRKLEEQRKIEEQRKFEEQKKIEEQKQLDAQKKLEEQKTSEEEEDVRYVMLAMVKAFNAQNEEDFKTFAIHMMDITTENPFSEGTPECVKFDEMMKAYESHNIRRVIVVAQQLCEIINRTEIYPEKIQKIKLQQPKKVLGVPEEEKEKKSWFKFLHPWKKEGEGNDSP